MGNKDLMREHGVLDRLLLVYEEGLRRLDSQQDFDPAVLRSAAQLIRRFIGDCHERLEARSLFPRFQQAGTLVDLVNVLL